MPDPSDLSLQSYVKTAAALLDLPLDVEQSRSVSTTFGRIAAFAADVASIDIGNEVEIAGTE
jgi:hypothetical protein